MLFSTILFFFLLDTGTFIYRTVAVPYLACKTKVSLKYRKTNACHSRKYADIKRFSTACFKIRNSSIIKVKVKWSRYRPGVALRVGRGIALLFHYRGTRRGWVVSSTPRPHFTPGKDLVPILQEAGWVPGPVWTGGKSRPHRDSIPDRPARSQSLYRLNYPAH